MKSLKTIAFALALAAPLSAPLPAYADAAQDGPPVADGDMGCFAALSLFAMWAGKSADDTTQSAESRAKSRAMEQQLMVNANLYFGRLMTLPPEKRTSAIYQATFTKVLKMDADAMSKYTLACYEWADKTRSEIVQGWIPK